MTQNQKTLAIAAFIIFAAGFIFFLGKYRYYSNPLTRRIYKEYYLNEIVKNNKIDAEKFWEFRDFYAGTTSSFVPENISLGKSFFMLSSDTLHSKDFLLVRGSPTIKKFVAPSNTKALLQTDNALVYEDGENVVIRFTKAIPEMETANGFFRYFGVKLKPYEGYLWYNETAISP